MSYLTDVNHNNCTTIQDVFDKYTSKEARRKYTYRLREVTKKAAREDNGDDDGNGEDNCDECESWLEPSRAHFAQVCKEFKADIDSDLRRVVTLRHDECASYLADMSQKGVLEMLSVTDLRRIKLFLKGFDEINNNICSKRAKWFIQRMPDDVFEDCDEDEDDERCVETNESDGELLFPISSDAVLNYIAPVRDSLEKLNVKLKTVVMDCFMDAIIEAKTSKENNNETKTYTTQIY